MDWAPQGADRPRPGACLTCLPRMLTSPEEMGAVIIPDGETGSEVETHLLEVPRLGGSSAVRHTCSGKLQSPPSAYCPAKPPREATWGRWR